MKAVCLWSGSRIVSTALMYSFAERDDTSVIDEPLYGNFLQATDAKHPVRDEIIPVINCDCPQVMQTLLTETHDRPEVLPPLTIQLPLAQLEDNGLIMQWQLFSALDDRGQTPAMVDSKELLLDPPGVLKQLCENLKIDYTGRMLTWHAGPREEDGGWAPYWYHAVHKSTGFSNYVSKGNFPDHLRPLVSECGPWYDKLCDRAIRASRGE